VINEAMARKFWPGQNAIGKRFSPGDDNAPWIEVVGVVGDVRQFGLGAPAIPETYLPSAQTPDPQMILVVRSAGDVAGLQAAVQHELAGLDPDLPLANPRTMEAIRNDAAGAPRFRTILLGLFAALAMTLAMLGVYGVMSYSVAQRLREIAIRVALGAQKRDVLHLVLGYGLRLTLGGILAGVVVALGLSRFLASLLFGVKPTDPLTFGVSSVLLAVVALLACFLPARRATRVDPLVALRYE
jgi:putative ABC transport system permease protein